MKIIFSQHALQQMFKRNVLVKDVKEALNSGEVIMEYEDDKPYPSKLLLYYKNDLPLHIVYAWNKKDDEIIIITTYHPDEKFWEHDFRSKRK